MVKKILLYIIFLGLCILHIAAAQNTTTTAVPFLLIAPDSRAGGMGETGVAIADNVWATYWNPAGLAFQKGSELALTHTNWLPGLGLSDVWIAHIAYKQPVEQLDGVCALQLTYLNLGEFNKTTALGPDIVGTFTGYEFAFAATYSTKLTEALGIGTSVRLIHSHLAGQGSGLEEGSGTSTGFCFDAGVLYRPKKLVIPFTSTDIGGKISFAANIANIGPKMSYVDRAQADPLPMNLRMGIAYNIIESEFNNMVFTYELSRLLVARYGSYSDEFYKAFVTTWMYKSFDEQIRKFNSCLGLEYWYGAPKLIGLRMGFFYEDPREGNRKFMTYGAGIKYDLYEFNFGYISALEDQHPLGETLRLTLSIGWGGE